jgi:hypothetical protein
MRERCCVVSGTERVLLLLYSMCTINIPKLAVLGCKAHVLASYLYALPSIKVLFDIVDAAVERRRLQ